MLTRDEEESSVRMTCPHGRSVDFPCVECEDGDDGKREVRSVRRSGSEGIEDAVAHRRESANDGRGTVALQDSGETTGTARTAQSVAEGDRGRGSKSLGT